MTYQHAYLIISYSCTCKLTLLYSHTWMLSLLLSKLHTYSAYLQTFFLSNFPTLKVAHSQTHSRMTFFRIKNCLFFCFCFLFFFLNLINLEPRSKASQEKLKSKLCFKQVGFNADIAEPCNSAFQEIYDANTAEPCNSPFQEIPV